MEYFLKKPQGLNGLAYTAPLLVPVVLVGSKIDQRGGEMLNHALDQEVQPVMDAFKEVETAIECSAKKMLNVAEVFYFASKAVVYPTQVLYDAAAKELRPECVSALHRIFKLCDKDHDGALSDAEFLVRSACIESCV